MTRAEFSTTTKRQTWDRAGGRCEACGKKFFPGDKREYDHRDPDAITKNNSPENCQLLCHPCHLVKTGQDRKDIAKCNRVRAKHVGAYAPKRKIPGSKGTPFKKKVTGEVVKR